MEVLEQSIQKPVMEVHEGARYKEAPRLEAGQVVGMRANGARFVVHGRPYDGENLIQGGQADIYLATYYDKNRTPSSAVLKVQKNMAADNYAEQFAAEAELQKGLSARSDDVVKFFDGGLDFNQNGEPFYWMGMERMASSLDRVIRAARVGEESLSIERVQSILVPSLSAVALHMHEELNIADGDLKPSNIMVDKNFRGKIGDVGAATAPGKVNEVALRKYSIPVDVVEHPLTESGLTYGTYEFMPPEGLIEGNEVDPKKADAYAAGMVIHLALGGNLPQERRIFVRGRPRMERPQPNVDTYADTAPRALGGLVLGLTDPNPDNRTVLAEGVAGLARV